MGSPLHGVAALVAAFLPDAEAGDVGHDVVRIAGDPDDGVGDLLLQAQRVIHHHLAAQGDPRELIAESRDLHRVGIIGRYRALLLQATEDASGVGRFLTVARLRALGELFARGQGVVGERDLAVGGADAPAQRLELRRQGGLDGGGERAAVGLGQLHRAPRIRILIAAASVHEHGDDPGVGLLQILLGIARVVAAELLVPQRGAVTAVAEYERQFLPVGTRHAEHGDGLIHRPVGIREVLPSALAVRRAAVHGEPAACMAVVQRRGCDLLARPRR